MKAKTIKLNGLLFALCLSIPVFAQTTRRAMHKVKIGFYKPELTGISHYVKFAEATLDENLAKRDFATNPHKTFQAFTVEQPARKTIDGIEISFRILFFDVRNKQLYEIHGLPNEGRPYGHLKFVSDKILQFERWSNPHSGIRYRIDVRRRKLIYATSIFDVDNLEKLKQDQIESSKRSIRVH